MSDRPNAPEAPAAPLSPAEIHRWLDFDLESLRTRREELLSTASRWLAAHATIEDDETQGDAAENRRMIAALLKTSEERRKERKEPFLEGGRAVDSWFNGSKLAPSKGFNHALEGARDQFTARMTPYAERKAEAARLEAEAIARAAEEEAQRAAAEAAEALASAPPAQVEAALERASEAATEAAEAEREASASLADRSRTYGDFGAVASLRTRWKYKIDDPNKVPRHLCSPDDAKIKDALKAGGRGPQGQPLLKIPGIICYPERTV